MDFFGHQDRARRSTRRLVVLFALAILAVLALVNGIGLAALHLTAEGGQVAPEAVLLTLAAGTGLTLLIIIGGSLYKIAELAAGGRAVAQMLGGRQLSGNTTDPDERRLLNVVEEMAIASGLPAPPVYLLDHEDGINAFAAGRSPRDCVIGVTAGALARLDRDELQGVIAHEFSHIIYGDMRLNLRLIGLLHGLLVLGLTGWMLMRLAGRTGRSRGKNSGQAALVIFVIGLGVWLIGLVGVFCGNLIKAAVSRQREFLADASAVQYTRNPRGIGGALRKISRIGSKAVHERAAEVSHMMFGTVAGLGGLLATHPPLMERIRRIDASLLGDAASAPASASALAGTAGFAGGAPAPTIGREELLLGLAQGAGSRHLDFGRALVAGLDPRLVQAIGDAFSARAVVYALLLDPDVAIFERQLALLRQDEDWKLLVELERLLPMVTALPLAERLPVLGLCMPALVCLTEGQGDRFLTVLDRLIGADGRTSLFEYALRRMVRHRLRPTANPGRATGADLRVLLSALARAGNPDDAAAAQALAVGARRLGLAAGAGDLLPVADCGWVALDGALDRLAGGQPVARRRLLEACADTVAADGRVRREEAELIRAIADSLDCPIPPLLG